MMKHTHLIFGFLSFLILNNFFKLPIYYAIFALIGAVLPDLDIKVKSLHRKIFHNIWFLAITVFSLMYFTIIDRNVAVALSTGFISHLVGDSLTHMGIMPLWPISRPKFNGPVRTGGTSEYILLVAVILAIVLIGYLV